MNDAKHIEEKLSYKLPFSERVGRNSLFTLDGNLISYVLRFISIPIILSIIEFDMGLYYIITSYAGLIILLSYIFNLGINLSSSKFISEYFSLKDEKKKYPIFYKTLFIIFILYIKYIKIMQDFY